MTLDVLTLRARDVMSSPPVTVSQNSTLAEAAKVMVDRNLGSLPVVDEQGTFVGMVTERVFQAELAGERPDSGLTVQERTLQQLYISGEGVLGHGAEHLRESGRRPVSEAMVKNEPTIPPDAEVWQVANTMLKSRLSHLAVVENGKPVGVIARHDLLKLFAESQS